MTCNVGSDLDFQVRSDDFVFRPDITFAVVWTLSTEKQTIYFYFIELFRSDEALCH